MSLKALPIYFLIALVTVFIPVQAYAADANVGNEVVDTFNTTLTRTGAGSAANPYKLQLNTGNANTWTGAQTFNSTLTANGILNLGDGGDAASLSGTSVAVSTADNNANAFYVQQGAIKYLQIKTTNATENISFGNTTTNPTYSFLGTGLTTLSGSLNVSGTLTTTGTMTANGPIVANNSVTTNNVVNVNNTFTASGSSNFSPSGTNDVTINSDTDSTVNLPGLVTSSGDALCVNGSDQLIKCAASGGGGTLQTVYDIGNGITTTDSRDIQFGLEDTVTDSDFRVYIASDNTVAITRNDNANIELPSQLLRLENLDTNQSVPNGLAFNVQAGGLTNAVDASDADIVNALSAGSNDLNGTNWAINGASGNIQTSGDVSVGGGDITSTAATANILNSSVTTLNLGGAATSVSIGANGGSVTMRNNTVSFPNAFNINANNATVSMYATSIGGGYGLTGVTISDTGNIQSDGTLVVQGTSTLSGNVTAASDLSVNGGDLITTSSTANLFNTNATTINLGGAAASLNLGSGVGTTTVNNNLTANGGFNVVAGEAFTANGNTVFSPNSTNDVIFSTDGDSAVIINGLSSASGTALCIDGTSQLILCASSGGGGSLQDSYNTGNTISTTNARDITYTLSDTTTDSNVNVNTASGATGYTAFNLQNGAGVNTPSQLIAIDNLDTDETLPVGLKVQSESGGINTAIDVSDAEIGAALSVGANDVVGTNWSINGSNGNVQTNGTLTANSISIGTLTTNGSSTLSPSSTNDVTVVTDTDSFLVINGLTTATADALCIDASDNVVKCSGTPSDRRLKTNITDITNVLPRVLKAQGVRYDLLKDTESAPGEGKNIGFIAQDLEELFPEVVKTDANGTKSVDYEKMTAVLVESTKEQQKQIDELKAEIEILKALITK